MFWFIIINVMVYYHYHKVDLGFSEYFFENLFFLVVLIFFCKGNIKNLLLPTQHTCLLIIV